MPLISITSPRVIVTNTLQTLGMSGNKSDKRLVDATRTITAIPACFDTLRSSDAEILTSLAFAPLRLCVRQKNVAYLHENCCNITPLSSTLVIISVIKEKE